MFNFENDGLSVNQDKSRTSPRVEMREGQITDIKILEPEKEKRQVAGPSGSDRMTDGLKDRHRVLSRDEESLITDPGIATLITDGQPDSLYSRLLRNMSVKFTATEQNLTKSNSWTKSGLYSKTNVTSEKGGQMLRGRGVREVVNLVVRYNPRGDLV